MRWRALLRGQFYRSRLAGFFLWLIVCGVLFLALDLYFGAHMVINMENSHSSGGKLHSEQKVRVDDPKFRAADLESLRKGGGDGRDLKSQGPRLINPHRLNNRVQICKHPTFDLKNDANKEAFYEMKPLACYGSSLFSVSAGVLSINQTLLQGRQLAKCVYRGIERFDDSYPTYTQKLTRLEEPFEIKIKHDFFRIQCNLKDESRTNRKLLKTNVRKLLKNNVKTENSVVDDFRRNFQRHILTSYNDEEADDNVNTRNFGEDVNNTDADENLADRIDYGNTEDTADESPDFDQFISQVYPSQEVYERISEIGKEMTERKKMQHEPINVLIVCLDSLSHLSYQRKLPVTYKFIRDSLGGIVLHGYNIVGDATTANLLPLLTGKAHEELPETRADVADSSYVDTYPLLWYKYERRGYTTLFSEDEPSIAAFNLRLNGFEHQPTDHYMRPFWQTVWGSSLNKDSMRFCLGDKPKHMYTLDYVRDFFNVYHDVPKFAFIMHTELTHWDNNPGEYIDKDLTSFLSDLRNSQKLNNTVVVLMGDHGARYSKVRWTVQGKLEERLPMMAWVIPEVFSKKYPKLMQNFKQNSHKLTTPFDVHETLLDILDPSRTSKPPKFSDRGISLFQPIPLNRTCTTAVIDMHWCTCLTEEAVEVSSKHVQNSVSEVMRYINQQTDPFRDSCEKLTIKSIKNATLVVPNEKVLRYRFSQDADHRVANFSIKAKLDIAYYQVTILTEPGEGLYEATVQANFLTSTYTVNAQVSRVNRYGNQAHCIEHKQPSIRKFCYCKPKNSPSE